MKIHVFQTSFAALLFASAPAHGFAPPNVVKKALFSSSSSASTSSSILKYQKRGDPPSSGEGNSQQFNTWKVLANTEQWISDTLESAKTPQGENPYSRKEVSYVCETNSDSPMIVANIFRRLRETREQGERHGMLEEDHAAEQGESYRPCTLRQTQVVVIPSNKAMTDSFFVFDDLITAINSARRNSRDYVTDVSFEKLDDKMYGESQRDWSVSINCAHLHPEFGKKTPEQILQEMKEEEEEGEVDLNLQEYKKKRLLARQSPYPTIVVEVRAVPPPDFGASPPTPAQEAVESAPASSSKDSSISSADIQKLEALFGKSAHVKSDGNTNKKEQENQFYNSIGQIGSIDEISTVTPMSMAQNWVAANDPNLERSADGSYFVNAAFTSSDAKHADKAYEFVFTNLAMQIAEDSMVTTGARRQYLVLPSFLSSSATSLEKFTIEVQKIVDVLPDLGGTVGLSTFHPEHVDAERRSPVPIVVLEYNKDN